jgi:PAS domain S-box-containing protein
VDITERKSAGEALRLSEESFQRVQNVEGIGVLHFDKSGRVIAANDTMLHMLGYSINDVESGRMSWRTWTPPEYMEQSETQMRRLAESGRIGPYETEIVRKDGTRLWIIFAGARLADGTAVEYAIDVTARKRAEESLREADRRKNEFMAILAHELRNPLAPIVAGIDVLKYTNGNKDAEHVRQTMERQARQLVRLIDDLMDVSRMVSGKLQVRLAPCDLNEAIRDAIEAVQPFVDQTQQGLTVEVPDEPIVIRGDLDRVTQVISNLLSNAVKYTPRKGRISVVASRDTDHAEVTVTDTGVGIDPEMRERVFDMFMQLPNEVMAGRTGLGIGLTLVKSIVDMHGGSVAVESGPRGKGSRFVVRFPLSDEAPRRATPIELKAVGTESARVMVVDDQLDAAQMLALIIEESGYDTRIAASGEEALKLGKKFEPDVILLDLGMPTMDGIETARQIRETPWGKSVTLVAVTGWGQEEDRRRTREAGFDYHLVKPADSESLLTILSRARRAGVSR